MDFKFGRYIDMVHRNKRPLKILEKIREPGIIQWLSKVLKYSLLSHERVKLRTSNLAVTLTGSIPTKPINIFREK